jgi:hypothetical protein
MPGTFSKVKGSDWETAEDLRFRCDVFESGALIAPSSSQLPRRSRELPPKASLKQHMA